MEEKKEKQLILSGNVAEGLGFGIAIKLRKPDKEIKDEK